MKKNIFLLIGGVGMFASGLVWAEGAWFFAYVVHVISWLTLNHAVKS